MHALINVAYVTSGVILPLYYVPQVVRLANDDSGLESYSMSKSATQTTLRVLMMPFVFGVGNPIMTFTVALDMFGRIVELGTALRSLRRQQFGWRRILKMCHPVAIPRVRFLSRGRQPQLSA